MLVSDMRTIGEKIRIIRKKAGLTQIEAAERASLSDRAYADIERGEANMRVETLLRICRALKVSPDEILTYADESFPIEFEQTVGRLFDASNKAKETAVKLISVYLDSLN